MGKNMTVAEFCEAHDACKEGRVWARLAGVGCHSSGGFGRQNTSPIRLFCRPSSGALATG